MNIDTSILIKLITIIAILQILPVLIYGIDKLLAKMGLFRIPEKALLATTFLFGILGSIAAIRIFKHKTTKSSFQHNFRLVVFLRVVVLVSLGLIIWKS
jgi:uncharacterized membrane protein YsdA (DUF1294 family)